MSIEREDLPTTIYTPDSAIASPRRLLRDMLRDLRASRELAWRLAVRDISAQYRQTLLGFFWLLAIPLAHSIIWIFLGLSGTLSVGTTSIPYPAYVLAGTLLWTIFTDAVQAPLQGVMESKEVLARINFPREAIILSGVYQVAFNACIKFALLAALLPLLGVPPAWSQALAPLGIMTILLAGLVLGLLLTPVGLLYTDIAKGLPLLLQFLMFLTPVIYPLPANGPARTLLLLNPLTPLVEVTRQWLTGQEAGMIAYLFIMALVALFAMLILWVVYRLAMPIVIERMGS